MELSGTAAEAGRVIQFTVVKATVVVVVVPKASVNVTATWCDDPAGKFVADVYFALENGSPIVMEVPEAWVMSAPSRVNLFIVVTLAGPMIPRDIAKSLT